MRKNCLFLLCAMLTFAITSCDSNKSKVKELATQFVAAVNGKDKATIADMYGDLSNFANLSLPNSIQQGEMTVEKDTSGNYVVTIDNTRQQKLIFKQMTEEKIKLIQTYSIFSLDSISTEIGLKSGVPMKQVEDRALGELLSSNGKFLTYLEVKFADVISGNLTYESGQWQSQGGWYPSVTVIQPIRNVGSTPVKGDEYNVEFHYYSPNETTATQTSVQNGVDLQPGEAYTYTLNPGAGYYTACMNHDFKWTISFVFKNQNPISSLLKYAKFSGSEYKDFIKKQQIVKKQPKTKK